VVPLVDRERKKDHHETGVRTLLLWQKQKGKSQLLQRLIFHQEIRGAMRFWENHPLGGARSTSSAGAKGKKGKNLSATFCEEA